MKQELSLEVYQLALRLKSAQWQKAKGELRALESHLNIDEFGEVNPRIEAFINAVEEILG